MEVRACDVGHVSAKDCSGDILCCAEKAKVYDIAAGTSEVCRLLIGCAYMLNLWAVSHPPGSTKDSQKCKLQTSLNTVQQNTSARAKRVFKIHFSQLGHMLPLEIRKHECQAQVCFPLLWLVKLSPRSSLFQPLRNDSVTAYCNSRGRIDSRAARMISSSNVLHPGSSNS